MMQNHKRKTIDASATATDEGSAVAPDGSAGKRTRRSQKRGSTESSSAAAPPSAAQPSAAPPSAAQPSDAPPSAAPPSDDQPSAAPPSAAPPSDDQPSDDQPSAAPPSAARPFVDEAAQSAWAEVLRALDWVPGAAQPRTEEERLRFEEEAVRRRVAEHPRLYALTVAAAKSVDPQTAAAAMYRLGFCHMFGMGCPVSRDSAMEWFLSAAQHGSAPAHALLAEAYAENSSDKWLNDLVLQKDAGLSKRHRQGWITLRHRQLAATRKPHAAVADSVARIRPHLLERALDGNLNPATSRQAASSLGGQLGRFPVAPLEDPGLCAATTSAAPAADSSVAITSALAPPGLWAMDGVARGLVGLALRGVSEAQYLLWELNRYWPGHVSEERAAIWLRFAARGGMPMAVWALSSNGLEGGVSAGCTSAMTRLATQCIAARSPLKAYTLLSKAILKHDHLAEGLQKCVDPGRWFAEEAKTSRDAAVRMWRWSADPAVVWAHALIAAKSDLTYDYEHPELHYWLAEQHEKMMELRHGSAAAARAIYHKLADKRYPPALDRLQRAYTLGELQLTPDLDRAHALKPLPTHFLAAVGDGLGSLRDLQLYRRVTHQLPDGADLRRLLLDVAARLSEFDVFVSSGHFEKDLHAWVRASDVEVIWDVWAMFSRVRVITKDLHVISVGAALTEGKFDYDLIGITVSGFPNHLACLLKDDTIDVATKALHILLTDGGPLTLRWMNTVEQILTTAGERIDWDQRVTSGSKPTVWQLAERTLARAPANLHAERDHVARLFEDAKGWVAAQRFRANREARAALAPHLLPDLIDIAAAFLAPPQPL